MKLHLFTFLLLASPAVFAQFTFREYSSTVDYAKDTMTINVTDNNTLSTYFYVKNIGGVAKNGLKIEREKLIEVSGTIDYFCWGITCYSDAAVSPNNPWVTPTPVDLNPGDSAALTVDFEPHNHGGTVHYRYRLLSSNGKPIDSMDVIYTGSLGIEASAPLAKLSVYPNPTNDYLYISTSNATNYAIKIVDMLGNLVYSSVLKTGFEKIDVTQFQKGVYFVTLNNNGKSITTKKIVISQ
jgi:hypothetical protein